jgi:hypothetical protein
VLVELGAVPADALVASVVVPVQDPAPPPGKGEEFGKASPIALVVIILLGIATVLLIVSMTKRLRRLPKSFDAQPEDRSGAGPGSGADSEGAGRD